MDENIDCIVRLIQVKGVGNVFVNKLICEFKQSDCGNLEEFSLNCLTAAQRNQYHQTKMPLLKEGCQVVSLMNETYPETLKDFLGIRTPPVLFLMGNTSLLNKKKVGFSGSRKVSEKGIQITQECVKTISEKNLVTVSGYAQGVDEMAHYTSLSMGGSTIFVLPNGIERFSLKKEFFAFWDWERVLIVSEFLPDDSWTVGRAMQRNNTIIGLSDAVVVVEAGITGGSLDAGRKTLRGGKDLFVPQYANVLESAKGNDFLISEGAHPIGRDRTTLKPNLSKLFSSLHISEIA